jgi:integrase
MPYIALPGFFIALRRKPSFGRLALEMLILTGVRSQEVRLATWAEFDFEERLWTVPADHMKRGKAHLVALSDAALAVLSKAKALQLADGDVVFPGVAGKPMSDITLLKELRDMSEPNHVHGFRSAFTNWAANEGFPDAVVEGRSGAIDARCGAGCLPPHNLFGHVGKARHADESDRGLRTLQCRRRIRQGRCRAAISMEDSLGSGLID